MATPEQFREWGRRGGQARASRCDMRELGAHGGQATVERHGRDHMAAIGVAGARECIRRHGPRFLAEIGRRYRLANPTGLEQALIEVLAQLGLVEGQHYEREGYLFPQSKHHHYTGDFVFRRAHLVIQVDGLRWHSNHSRQIGARAEMDRCLDEWLAARRWTVVRLSEALITGERAALLAAVRAALAGQEVPDDGR